MKETNAMFRIKPIWTVTAALTGSMLLHLAAAAQNQWSLDTNGGAGRWVAQSAGYDGGSNANEVGTPIGDGPRDAFIQATEWIAQRVALASAMPGMEFLQRETGDDTGEAKITHVR